MQLSGEFLVGNLTYTSPLMRHLEVHQRLQAKHILGLLLRFQVA